ncbi:Cob(I)yrinic acid a,c-diamide adenosyltransferase [Candidatus Bealeia paramacronuclearis]|uniref:Corrinoid adenosyltransferase n=1 Tax=Candidatus Bealeia paramacronuclearis TaxID=1921001 RepID=A0ABZ2C546_9PROT|nr:Cob(I)yrinic acid a,c-diamide adenosyltransferase [Candidatus Bealeia paramacronuclearis]
MVQLTRIYTRGGDKGKTSLGTGERVSKYDLRIEVIGEIDEANAALGLVAVESQNALAELLSHIQNDLFDVGANLCVPMRDNDKPRLRIQDTQVKYLEDQIDFYNENLLPLTSFILPGGNEISARIHLARCIVRRAERRLCHLADLEIINPGLIQYVNRLSDLLFVLARVVNNNGAQDILWRPGGNTSP